MTTNEPTRRNRRGRWLAPLAISVALTGVTVPITGASADEATAPEIDVIVRYQAGSAYAAGTRIDALGGRVTSRLAGMDTMVATMPASAVDDLRASSVTESVVPDGSVQLLGAEWTAPEVTAGDAAAGLAPVSGSADGLVANGEAVAGQTLKNAETWVPDRDMGSLYSVTKGTGVQDAWSKSDGRGRKITGKDVGVALIDSGVSPVPGLSDGQVTDGPDLSFDSQTEGLQYIDTFGHGTHMAGIITGRDDDVKDGNENDSKHFVGVAPDSRLLNMKVAATNGATDVSQVIAAIDWVVAHRADPGLNIRVINLSFGTNGTQSYQLDPLAHAAEVAWRKGIVVVVAAGNDGNGTESLGNPALDPYVIAVGASDHMGTEKREDDTVASFSNRGSTTRSPDLIAPGRSLVSLRTPSSTIDQENPSAVVTYRDRPRLFRGSGTSQAAAFVTGAAALLLQQRPSLSPDQVKRILTATADPVPGASPRLQGAGIIDMKGAIEAPTPRWAAQTWPVSTGTGSLDLARGDHHVFDPEDGTELRGEIDIFGQAWDGRSWARASWEGRSWAGGTWNGRSWAGEGWNGRSWAGVAWTGRSWAGRSWAGRSWAGRSWAGRSWAGRSWAWTVGD